MMMSCLPSLADGRNPAVSAVLELDSRLRHCFLDCPSTRAANCRCGGSSLIQGVHAQVLIAAAAAAFVMHWCHVLVDVAAAWTCHHP